MKQVFSYLHPAFAPQFQIHAECRTELLEKERLSTLYFRKKMKEINDYAIYAIWGYSSMDEYCRTVFFGYSYNDLMGISNE